MSNSPQQLKHLSEIERVHRLGIDQTIDASRQSLKIWDLMEETSRVGPFLVVLFCLLPFIVGPNEFISDNTVLFIIYYSFLFNLLHSWFRDPQSRLQTIGVEDGRVHSSTLRCDRSHETRVQKIAELEQLILLNRTRVKGMVLLGKNLQPRLVLFSSDVQLERFAAEIKDRNPGLKIQQY